MEARLLGISKMQEIAKARDVSGMLSVLMGTDYGESIVEFGGMDIKSELVDFALSKNLAKNMAKLVDITPDEDHELLRIVVAKWDLYNVKLMLEAKERKLAFEDIAASVIDAKPFDSEAIRAAMDEETAGSAIGKLFSFAPKSYQGILAGVLKDYKASKSALETVSDIDDAYYSLLSGSVERMRRVHKNAAAIMSEDIDMRNLLIMIKAKERNLDHSQIARSIMDNGTLSKETLKAIYKGASGVAELARSAKIMGLEESAKLYDEDGRLIHLEIGMKNSLLRDSVHTLRYGVLSFGAIVAYVYLKELEVSTLRVLLKGKQYGLADEEMNELMAWKL